MSDIFGIEQYKKEAEELNAKNYEIHFFMLQEQKRTNQLLETLIKQLSK